MTEETDLIIAAITSVQKDIRQIRDTQQDQGKSLTDLCGRMSLTEEGVKNHIKINVKSETKPFKFITLALTVITGISTSIYYLKMSGII